MKFITSLFIFILLAVSFTSHAGFEATQAGNRLKVVNKLNCVAGVPCTITGRGVLQLNSIAVFDYDFADDGGAIGTIATGVKLPAKATIEKCWFRVQTQLVDAGAGTIAVQCEDANNILSAADQTGVADGTFLASAVTGTAANMVDDIAAACDLSYVIAGADLTAGKIRGYCRYSVHE